MNNTEEIKITTIYKFQWTNNKDQVISLTQKSFELQNIKSFKRVEKTEVSKKINILVGPNNSGKSTILSSIHYLQKPAALSTNDITLGQKAGKINLYFEGNHQDKIVNNSPIGLLEMSLHSRQIQISDEHKRRRGGNINHMPQEEPGN